MARPKFNKNLGYEKLKKISLEQGAGLFGVAGIGKAKEDFCFLPRVTEKLDKAISMGVRLSGAILEEIDSGPTKLYFHHYRSLNMFLDQLALRVSNLIQAEGFLALPIPASLIIDWQNQKAHLSHKQIGYLAGLGWIGRNNLLVNKKLGSQFRLVTVLTNLDLKVDSPAKGDCQGCKDCMVVCPAGAIKISPQDFNHLACFEKLKEFQRLKLADQYVCGICVKACRPKV